MAMDPEVHEALMAEDHPLQTRILGFARRRLQMSQNFMSQRFPKLQEEELLYRNFRDPDKEDLELEANPLTQGVRKIVVPMSYAIIQTILAWQMSFFTERKPIIPVEGLGPHDFHPAIIHEHLFEYQYDRQRPKGALQLLQWFLDGMRYGIGIVMNAWTIREFLGYMRSSLPLAFSGEVIGFEDELHEQTMVAYEGNQVVNIMPYDWFPDPRVPLARFQDGEFVAYRTQRSRIEVEVKEDSGLYAGVDYMPRQAQEFGGKTTGSSSWNDSELGSALGVEWDPLSTLASDGHTDPFVQLHHLYALVPPEIIKNDRLSPGRTPRVWIITLGNLGRVIRLEQAKLPYPAYPFSIIEPNFDQHSPMNPGLLEILAGPNYHLNWLVNSREQNVRRSMNFELLYDPSLVEREDLENPQPSGLIRLKADAYHEDIRSLDRAVKPMPVQDVTASHMNDVGYWVSVMEQVSGANKAMQGLSNPGRRAATEVAYQQQLAAGRMKLLSLIFALQGVVELSEMQLANTQTFLAERLQLPVLQPYKEMLGVSYLDVAPDLLRGSFRIPLLEQGIPTDKVFHVNALKEVLQMMVQGNPQAAAQLAARINLPEIFAEIMLLLGKRNLRDFFLPPGAEMQQGGQLQLPPGGRVAPPNTQVSVQPDEQVMRQVERGNLVPMGNGGGGPVGPGSTIGTPDPGQMLHA